MQSLKKGKSTKPRAKMAFLPTNSQFMQLSNPTKESKRKQLESKTESKITSLPSYIA
jgi:hypothetical protein